MVIRLASAAALLVALAACSSKPEAPASATTAPAATTAPSGRKYLLERVDDASVVQLYADGFTQLPLNEKQLVYHLTQAAIAGRDIYWDQRYAHGLAMRGVLEQILTHSADIDPATLTGITRYTKLVWINSGPYNNLPARKFVLAVTPEAFAAAAANASGVTASTNLRAVRLL